MDQSQTCARDTLWVTMILWCVRFEFGASTGARELRIFEDRVRSSEAIGRLRDSKLMPQPTKGTTEDAPPTPPSPFLDKCCLVSGRDISRVVFSVLCGVSFTTSRRLLIAVELVNSQIMLKGLDTKGCVLVAAGNAKILNRLHRPVWSKGELFNKNTWVGHVQNVQVPTPTRTQNE